MRKIICICIPVSIILFGCFIYLEKNNTEKKFPYISYSIQEENKNEEHDGPEKVLRQEFLMTRDPNMNVIPTGRLVAAKKKMEQMISSSVLSRTYDISNTNSLSWSERGPNNVGGRTRAILVDKNDVTGNTVFAGSAGGGLWKTTNFKAATPTWNAINDFFANISVSCIKQSPVNPMVLYFGTGEGWGNSDAIQGLGIWKSTNGGVTWSQLPSTSSLTYVNDLEFDNNGYIYATTRTTNVAMRGVLRSSDGGATWTQVLTDPVTTTRGADLERAANGDMYATLGIFTTGKIFRSPVNGTNTGIGGSWTNITPPDITSNAYQRTEIALAASGRIYAVAQNGSTYGVGALYRSDNNGSTWTTLANANWCDQGASTNTDFTRGQAWYDLILAVDPNNQNNAIAGGVVLEKTSNSGSSWSQMTRWTSGASCTSAPVIHADIHEVQYLSSSEIIVGTDGGMYYSNDGGATFSNKNNGFNVTQYYSAAISGVLGSNLMIAGAQDNGSHLFSSIGVNSVSTIAGGDGGFCFIDQTNALTWVTGYTYGNYSVFRNFGNLSATINDNTGRFINPADYDDNLNILYYGQADGFYGRGFNIESGSLSADAIDVSTAMGTNRQVSSIKIDPNTSTTIWLGCSNSENTGTSVVPKLIKVTKANGPTTGPAANQPNAVSFAGPSLPAGSYISSIDIEQGNSNHMLLTASNYGVASVWESTDGGTTWTSLDNNGVNLPDMPIRWGMFIPPGYAIGPGITTNGIMLATEIGVWSTLATSGTLTNWTSNTAGLANVRVDMLRLRKSDKTIVAATHGRGLFTTLVPTVLSIKLADFEGELNNNAINLNWSTQLEQDLKHFEVQKSSNGTDYFTIGIVNASGNSNSVKKYGLKDLQVNESNYYRLKMVEYNGQSTVSNVVLIKNRGVEQQMWVINNPFTDHLKLRFAKKPTRVLLRLTNLNGSLITEKSFGSDAEQINWQLPNSINTGAYILTAIVDEKSFNKKLIKN